MLDFVSYIVMGMVFGFIAYVLGLTLHIAFGLIFPDNINKVKWED